MDCYVLGPTYMADRDALVQALESDGAGQLIHPYLGTLTVRCDRARMGEGVEEGGLARFSLEFVEDGAEAKPAVSADTQAQARNVAANSQSRLQASYGERFPTGLATFATVSLVDLIGVAVGAIAGAAARTAAGFESAETVGLARAELTGRARAITTGAANLTAAPLLLAQDLSDLLAGVRAIAATPTRALGALLDLTSFGDDLVLAAATTARRQQQREAQQALSRLVQQLAAVECLLAAAAMTFDSYDQAVAVRSRICDALDGMAIAAGDAGDDEAYEALGDMRLAAARDITARGGSLRRLASLTLQTSRPALVVAYSLYGDASRADEVALRNGLMHPGFAPGGVELQVLSRG